MAYDNATDGAVLRGLGYIRVTTDYCDEQDLSKKFKSSKSMIGRQFILMPSSKEPDGSDANHAFVHEEISKDQFKHEYPDAKITTMTEWSSVGDSDGGYLKFSWVAWVFLQEI